VAGDEIRVLADVGEMGWVFRLAELVL